MTRGLRPFTLSEVLPRRPGEALLRRLPHGHSLTPRGPPAPRARKQKRGDLETSIIEIPALDAFAAEAEERGKVEAHELDALGVGHELDEERVTAFRTLLTGRGVELPVDEDELELDLTPGSGPATTDSLGL